MVVGRVSMHGLVRLQTVVKSIFKDMWNITIISIKMTLSANHVGLSCRDSYSCTKMSPFFPHAFWVVGSRHTCPPSEINSGDLVLVLPAPAAADPYYLNVSSTKHSNCKITIRC